MTTAEREMVAVLREIETDLESSSPIDRLRLLARVRQALANAASKEGRKGVMPK